jgi:Leucine-rich repeat (LRR) protein
LDSLRVLVLSENGMAARKEKVRRIYDAYQQSGLDIFTNPGNPAYFMNKSRVDSARQATDEAIQRVNEAPNRLVPKFGRCRRIRQLSLSDNASHRLHRSVKKLKGLEQINLSSNRFTSIPGAYPGWKSSKASILTSTR